jgi:hypothetical protein
LADSNEVPGPFSQDIPNPSIVVDVDIPKLGMLIGDWLYTKLVFVIFISDKHSPPPL